MEITTRSIDDMSVKEIVQEIQILNRRLIRHMTPHNAAMVDFLIRSGLSRSEIRLSLTGLNVQTQSRVSDIIGRLIELNAAFVNAVSHSHITEEV